MSEVHALSEKLVQYQSQLQQIEQLLGLDPQNPEILQLQNDLIESIRLTTDLIRIKARGGVEDSSPKDGGAGSGSDSEDDASISKQTPRIGAGHKLQAMYSADGVWYDATVETVHPDGSIQVRYDGYGNVENVTADKIRERQAGGGPDFELRKTDQTAAKPNSKGAPKRPADKDKGGANKRKKQEDPFSGTVASWKKFVAKSKTAVKHDSIFATTEEGKVGVVNSGKGMTEYRKKATNTNLVVHTPRNIDSALKEP